MITTNPIEYVKLTDADRERVRDVMREMARRAGVEYARILAAEAVAAVRVHYPTASRLVFEQHDNDEMGDPVAEIVAVFDPTGESLWSLDADDEFPDDSEVNDPLSGALAWSRGDLFRPDPANPELFEFDLLIALVSS